MLCSCHMIVDRKKNKSHKITAVFQFRNQRLAVHSDGNVLPYWYRRHKEKLNLFEDLFPQYLRKR